MATKKKNKKRPATSKKTAGKKATPAAKRTTAKKSAKKKAVPKKVLAMKKSVKPAASAKAGVVVRDVPKKRPARSARAFSGEVPEALPGSGDLQGLSNVAEADSESVDELLEEGDAFEAGIVSGVEDADDHEGQEVHTHEVPEDDVPSEYLDEE